ncbi:MAG TPA: sodium:solute symporter [Crocinitomicaceae bacterium]|nr:sodium:solute symporter [Flavobacteriales bacterium]HBW87197.1 sodium:solute symporter [Crocinitomicaceae bacterium]
MSQALIITVLIAYFGILILISFLTSRNASSDTFFTGDRQSPWYLVAFGMIGASLSGVTFISVPGKVVNDGMAYFQVVMGYVLGYIVIAQLLMPIYYRLNVTSIYEFLEKRLGLASYKTGAAFFILSRTLGSAIRLYLATVVLQLFLFDDLGVPYWLTACITILLIWVYTFKGGIKTIVYTDTFQTFFLISAVVICTVIVANALNVDLLGLWDSISETKTTQGNSMTRIFVFDDPNAKNYFWKHFFGGMFLTIAMTGLDQDLMQKNLTCKNINDAKKNMYSFTGVLLVTNLLFLILGGALYVYAFSEGITLPAKTDHTFPTLALDHFGTIAGIFFLLGITASSYASADSALAALTTGFCIDFLNFKKREEPEKKKLMLLVHIGFSVLFLLIILATNWYISQNPKTDIIDIILTLASYTYGPLIGLFAFGIFTKRVAQINWLVPVICILVPIFCYLLDKNADLIVGNYKFGYEMLIINGSLTFTLLYLFSVRTKSDVHATY